MVLGSAQPERSVDLAAAAAAGVEVVRRRSGGGAVLVGPGQVVWVDLVVPAGDPLWSADVGRAMWWVGDLWVAALADVGVEGVAAWHGALRRSRWSDLVCFAGLGPGEVTVRGAKVVGVSQRRTRAGALLQCAALRSWQPEALLGLLALSAAERAQATAELRDVALGLDVDPEQLVAALVRRLPDA